jgi:hypothetical protein
LRPNRGLLAWHPFRCDPSFECRPNQ